MKKEEIEQIEKNLIKGEVIGWLMFIGGWVAHKIGEALLKGVQEKWKELEEYERRRDRKDSQ